MKTTLTTLARTATLTAPVLAGGHITPPTTVLGQDCCGLVGDGDSAYNGKKNGWEAVFRSDGSAFKNQGDCIQYVNTGK